MKMEYSKNPLMNLELSYGAQYKDLFMEDAWLT
jgi:hypothetical protein